MITLNLSTADVLSNLFLFKKENGRNKPNHRTKTTKKTETEQKEYKEKHILCKFCEHKITTTACKIEVHGDFKHTFLNPAGHIFEIGCFAKAEGCIALGIPSDEWTWFQDFRWQVALCEICSSHLGWFYRSDKDQAFFGLILNALI